jgi:hypothetical protein
VRVAPETLLDGHRKGVHTPPHIRYAACDPHPRPRWKRNHLRNAKALISHAAATMSKSAGSVIR